MSKASYHADLEPEMDWRQGPPISKFEVAVFSSSESLSREGDINRDLWSNDMDSKNGKAVGVPHVMQG